jgi:hypothetical protein
MMRHVALALLCLGLSGTTAYAQDATAGRPTRGIDARQAAQAQRIRRGLEQERLTVGEARRLRRVEERIADAERRLRDSGGRLTRRERIILHQRLNVASRAIFRAAHNRR